jgi:hypothetical protein
MSATCPDCGGPVRFVTHEGKRIPLDRHEVSRGEGRFAEGPEGLVPVRADADVLAYTDHRETCPVRRRGGT